MAKLYTLPRVVHLLLLLLTVCFPSRVLSGTYLRVDNTSHYLSVSTDVPETPSVVWDKVVQMLVAEKAIGPTRASGAYGMVHTAMYNAWSVYDKQASPSVSGLPKKRPRQCRSWTNKFNAMNYAAFSILFRLFPGNVSYLQKILNNHMISCKQCERQIGKKIGFFAAKAVYNDYRSVQNHLHTFGLHPEYFSSTTVMESWNPETVPIDDPNGKVQSFLTPWWGWFKTFVIDSNGRGFFPSEPPKLFLLQPGEVVLGNRTISLYNGTTLIISKNLIGTVINPAFIRQAEIVVRASRDLTDKTKTIAEFWEDGTGTSYPPGTWMTFAQYVSARDRNCLDEDAKLFFSMGNAVRDAGIISWAAKRIYSYTRPIESIRTLGKLGLIGEYDHSLGGNAITAYSLTERKAVRMLASKFGTYQRPGADSSPPFPEFVSGHSAFSASASKVLELFTGREFFGAGVAIQPGSSLFETASPKKNVLLHWQTFRDAAKEAGISRLYGGIHFPNGNNQGFDLGSRIGKLVHAQSMRLFNRSFNYYRSPCQRKRYSRLCCSYVGHRL